MNATAITAIGTYVPERALTNADLERMVDTSDEWIVQRTGIRERRIAESGQFTSDLSAAAVEDLISRSGKTVADVDFIIVCTSTPDYGFPSVACRLQARFSIHNAGAVDISATCAGFPYGLQVANGLAASGLYRKILVVAADTLSKVTDYTDRTTCILFGDGAGAVLVEPTDGIPGFLSHYAASDGDGGKHVYRTGLSAAINGAALSDTKLIVQNGREVYKWAVSTVPDGMRRTMEGSGYSLDSVDWFVPHNANLRIVESVCEKSGFPLERTLCGIERYGNTSAASIPLALDLGLKHGKVKPGDLVLLYGFGGGLVQAGQLVRWTAV